MVFKDTNTNLFMAMAVIKYFGQEFINLPFCYRISISLMAKVVGVNANVMIFSYSFDIKQSRHMINGYYLKIHICDTLLVER